MGTSDQNWISPVSAKDLAKYIDHTQLSLEADESAIKQLCKEAKQFEFKTVCVRAKWLSVASIELQGSKVWPITVVSFPSGEGTAFEKANETEEAVKAGAREIDMVLNRKHLIEKDYISAYQEIAAVVQSAMGAPVKVILETSELDTQQKVTACTLVKAAGADFVKTSTGFSSSGATVEDISLMRDVVGKGFGVKASGGIRNLDSALRMIEAGASRIGMSASVSVMEEMLANR